MRRTDKSRKDRTTTILLFTAVINLLATLIRLLVSLVEGH